MKKNVSSAAKTSAANAKGVSATLSAAAVRKLSRLTVLLALIAPLLDTVVIFPLRQIILANSTGNSWLYLVFLYLTELLNLAAFFLLLALAVYCAVANSTRILGRILALNGVASVFIVILLRIGVYYLLAWLDSVLVLPFSLCNQTLGMLTADSSQMVYMGLSLFINQILLFAILLLASLIALWRRQKALKKGADLAPLRLFEQFDESPLPRTLQIGVIAYAVLALVSSVWDTVSTITNVGAPDSFSTLLSLIVPYFLLAIYCFLCYLVLDYGTRYIARQCAQ